MNAKPGEVWLADLGLAGAFGAGDRAGDGIEHEDPAQRELRERRVLGYEPLQFFHGFQPGFVVHAGESFAAVEGFAVTVELAVIVGAESRLARHLAGEQTAGEWNAG